MDPESPANARRLPLALICFAASVAVALPWLGHAMFDPKEADLVAIGARPLADLWDIGFQNQSHGWPLLMHFWVMIGGAGEWWTRLLSVLLSSLGALWVFRLGELLVSRKAGVAAALSFIMIPSVHWHMREARMYGLFTALTLGALYYAVSWERRRRRWDLPAAILCSVAAAYVHFFGIGIAGAVIAFLVVGALLGRQGALRDRLGPVAVGGAATLLAIIPQLLRVRAGMKYSGPPNPKYGLTGEWGDGLHRIGHRMWMTSDRAPRDWPELPTILLFVGLLLFVVGVFQIRERRDADPPIWWTRAALTLFVFGAGIGFIVLASRSDVRPRYLSFLAGPIALGIGAALTTPRRRLWLLVYPLAGLLLWASFGSFAKQHAVERGDLTDVLTYLTQEAAPNDTVVAVPSFAANLVRLKSGRAVTTRRNLTAALRKGQQELATDTIWMVHVTSQGGTPQMDFLDHEYRLVEQRVGPKATMQRWSRPVRDAGRDADLDRVLARAPSSPGRTRVAMTGIWRGTNAKKSALGLRLDRGSDLLMATAFRPSGGRPIVGLEPGRGTPQANGDGWTLHARTRSGATAQAPAIIAVALDLKGWTYKRIPPRVRVKLKELSTEGAVILRLLPPAGAAVDRQIAMAKEAIAHGARVVTVDRLPAAQMGRFGAGLLLPDLGVFSSRRGRSHAGYLALITLDADGVHHADVLATASAPSGAPRVDGLGILHIPPPSHEPSGRKKKLKKVKFDADLDGSGASILELYPRSVQAVQDEGKGVQRECRPLEGRTFLYDSEGGPGDVGSLADRLLCGTNQLKEMWKGAARAKHYLGGEPRDCLWLHPTGKLPMRLLFEDVALGRRLQGHLGVTDTASWKAKGIVDLEVRVDGEPVYRGKTGEAKGWFPWAADTSRFGPGTHDLEFLATTNKPRWRHLCFDAEVLP